MADTPRIRLNLDAAGAFLDACLAHPAARVLEQLAPGVTGHVQTLRDNLPDVAAGVQARTVEHLRNEVAQVTGGIERRAVRALGSFLDEALVAAKKRTPPARRLKPPRKAKPR